MDGGGVNDGSIDNFKDLGKSLKNFIQDTTETPIRNMKRRLTACKCGRINKVEIGKYICKL